MATECTSMWVRGGRKFGTLGLITVLALASGGSVRHPDPDGGNVIPGVPDEAFEAPASVHALEDTALMASPEAAVPAMARVSTGEIPAKALFAYKRAAMLLADSDPGCKLPWSLVAAIGRVESNHGRINGSTLNSAGVARPGIYGVPLNGSGTPAVNDSDGGTLDHDARWDRAVGPMQFIPATWKSVAIDSDLDGVADPQNIADAAASAGVYLCSGTEDLSKEKGARAAVLRYNHSRVYADKVLAIARQYERGDFSGEVLMAAPPTVQLLPEPIGTAAPAAISKPQSKVKTAAPERPLTPVPSADPPPVEPPAVEPPPVEPPPTEPAVVEPPAAEPAAVEPPPAEPPAVEPPPVTPAATTETPTPPTPSDTEPAG